MPVLSIIAGPNGAGKSSHSKELLSQWNIEAFDFDKVFYGFWSDLSFDPAVKDGSFDRALNLYADLKEDALQNDKDFAFESNYHTHQILSTMGQFRSKGYLLRLIFIFLDDVETAIARVKDRVAKGGHWVDEDTIRDRFARGLELLDKSFDAYDEVHLFQSVPKTMNGIAMLNPPDRFIISMMPIPSVLESALPRLKEFMQEN